jgi:BlaI family penicillinase repressor
MAIPKLTTLELRIMEAVWKHGACSVREIQEAFPKTGRPAYTTIQTTVYRLESKEALRRVKKISNAHIFEAVVSPRAVRGRLIDDLMTLFGGGGPGLLMAHLIESGKLTRNDIAEAEEIIAQLERKGKSK